MVFGQNSQIRVMAEAYACEDTQDKFVRDLISAQNKFMNLDRFDLAISQQMQPFLKSLPLKLPKVNAEIQHACHLYHLHPAFKQFMRAQLSVTEKIANEILSLPIDSSMHDSEVEKVAELISRFFQLSSPELNF